MPVSLDNLLKIGRLKEHLPDAGEIRQLLAAARRNLSDAGQTVVQALTLTIGLPANRVTVLDTLRRKRNLSDYTGEDVDESSARACVTEAHRLLNDVATWLKANRPGLPG